MRYIYLVFVFALLSCSGKKAPTEPKKQDPPPTQTDPASIFETFYEEWWPAGNGRVFAAVKYFGNLSETDQTLPVFGGFLMDREYNLVQLIIGGYYEAIDQSLLPKEELRIYTLRPFDEAWAIVSIDLAGLDSLAEKIAYGLVFKSYGNRSTAEIKARVDEYLLALRGTPSAMIHVPRLQLDPKARR